MNKKALFTILYLGNILLLNSQIREDLRVDAEIISRCKVQISSNNISFTRVDPNAQLPIPQNEPPIEVIVKGTFGRGEKVYLRIQAEGNLTDPISGQTIPADTIYWEASGNGFDNGTLAPSVPIGIGRWNKSGTYHGSLFFYFNNDPSYAPGVYYLTVNITVSSF